MERNFLSGLAVAGFRSFGGPGLQRIGPLSKVHLLAGPNNAGKSNVLEVAIRGLPALRNERAFESKMLDAPLRASADDRQLRIGVLTSISSERLRQALGRGEDANVDAIRELFLGPTFASELGDSIWIEFTVNDGKSPSWMATEEQTRDVGSQLDESVKPRRLRQLSKQLSGQWNDQNTEENAAQILATVVSGLKVREQIPDVARIGAFRRITASEPGDVIEGDHDGAGLIGRLARLQNPGIEEPENRERFARINRFVQSLFDDDDAEIDVPHDRKTLLIRYDGEWLPLENYGTGLHEVIVLAAASTVLSGHLVCIEEPEIHLHPTLQRKLLRYLVEETDNQYLIATHSAHLLDSERGSISAVRLEGGNTVVEAALEPSQVAAISTELGVRASDLVQANTVIWVEGPSDRTYLRGWIGAVAPELVEGVHYSLLFYGGRLLAHLTADDPAVQEFISLPRINRNFTIVFDSDRSKPGAKINATKTRVKKELESLSGHLPWVTLGYTIENYVPPSLLSEVVSEVHPEASCSWKGDRYQDPLHKRRIRGRTAPVDKPAIAELIIARWDEVAEWPLDLSSQVKRLVELIRKAND